MTDKKQKNTSYSSLSGFHRAVPIILFAMALFIGVCFFVEDIGAFGNAISSVLLGLFAYGAYLIPFLLALHAIFYAADVANKTILSRAVFSFVTVVAVSAFIYAVSTWGEKPPFEASQYYRDGQVGVGGGFIGSIVAFGIIRAFGTAGLVIITLAIVAIYLSFFFSGGKGGLKKTLFYILKALVFAGAFVENKIKALFAKMKRARGKKKINSGIKKNHELGSDDFFEVDNGLETLKISELGILETRSSRTLEARPTLQSKIHHKSEYSDSEAFADYSNEKTEFEEEFIPKKKNVGAFSFGDEPFANHTESAFSTQNDYVVSENKTGKGAEADDAADSIFTEDFDPFKLAKCEAVAARPSSRAEKSDFGQTVTESISDLTESELERIRAREAFERRKAEIISKRRAEAVPQKQDTDLFNERKSVEFHQTVSESFAPCAAEDEKTVSLKIDKAEEPEEEVREDIPPYTELMKEEKTSTSPDSPYEKSIPFTEAYEMRFGTPESSDKAEADFSVPVSKNSEAYENSYMRAARFSAATVHTVTQKPTQNYESSEESEAAKEFIPYSAPSAENIEKDENTVFDFNEKKESGEERITLQRTAFSLSDELDYEDEDEDENEDENEELIEEYEDGEDEDFSDEPIPEEEQNPTVKSYRDMFSMFRNEDKDEAEYEEQEDADEEEGEDEPPFDTESPIADLIDDTEPGDEPQLKKKNDYSNFKLPPIDLLGLDEVKDDDRINAEINENTRILIETLESFNVTASIKGVDRGPRITRYEVVPARGVKVKEITGRFEDIELNLAAEGVRMEAPIPGKSAIGFEIPNKHPTNVRLRELIETEEFMNAKSNTFVSIGKDVAGNPVFGDIAKYPHALICGATGMGKSVCINSIMISMLFKSRPDQVRFIMIDPKKVEFKIYSGIPHLLIPVITEAKQAAGALMWAVEEMERRYEIIEKHSLRNLDAYNEKAEANPKIGTPLPKIVIVIDELNDLMMQVRDPVEDLIMRIAQKARAAGIHLVLGTQRPSVQVITGNIKANIPTRISCKVSSQTDSRTVFDMGGAEKLLNKGDMLYWPVDRTAPLRVQGAFVSDAEVEAVMNFLKSEATGEQYDEEVLTEINKAAQKCTGKKSGGYDEDDEDDDQPGYYSDQRFLDAVELAIRSGKVSTSLLQRKLSIGYGKAAKYIDAMESIGIVSEPNGQRPRDVLITMDEWHEKLSRVELD